MKQHVWYWIIGIAIAAAIVYFVWKNKSDKDEKKNLTQVQELGPLTGVPMPG